MDLFLVKVSTALGLMGLTSFAPKILDHVDGL